MRADLPAGDPPRVEELDQVRPRHLQKLGRPPRPEFGAERRQGDSLAVRHPVEDLPEQRRKRRSSRRWAGWLGRNREVGRFVLVTEFVSAVRLLDGPEDAHKTARIIWAVLRDQRNYQNEPPVQAAAA